MTLGPVPDLSAGTEEPPDAHWRPAPLALLRRTGFPVRLVECLADPGVGEALAAHATAHSSAGATRSEFLESGFPRIVAEQEAADAPRTVFKHLYRVRRAVERGTTPSQESRSVTAALGGEAARWMTRLAEAADALDRCEGRLEEAAARALEHARTQVWGCAADPRFREAVLLSNPGAWERVLRRADGTAPAVRNSKVRRSEWLLYAYLQRFCTKNESVSFFGPVDPVRVDPEGPSLLLERRPGTLQAHWLRASHWAAQALADRIAADPEIAEALPLRPAPGCALSRDRRHLLLPTGRRIAPPPAAVAALHGAEAGLTLAELTEKTGPEAAEAARGLLDRGLLRRDLPVPTAVDDPLGWLRHAVAALPETGPALTRWRAELDAFAALVEVCGDADPAERPAALFTVEQRFADLSGHPARRADGAIYADRLVVTEDCRGDVVEASIGGRLLDHLSHGLEPVLRLCASYSLTVADAVLRRAVALHAELAAGGTVGLLPFLSALDGRVPLEEVMADPAVVAFTGRLAALVRSHSREGRADLAPGDLAGLLRPLPPGLSVSPDVMFVADGEGGLGDRPRLVIGEIHHGTQVWTHLTALAPELPRVAEGLAGLLEVDGRAPAALVHRRTQGKAFERDLPGPDIEVLGRSAKPAGQRVRAAEIDVVADPGGALRLHHPDHPGLFLRPRDPRAASSWLFGPPPVVLPPLDLGADTPRTRVGEVVVWRRTRLLPRARYAELLAAAGPAELLLAADRLRRAHGLPVRGFVRVPGERKPFWADLTEPLGLEHLAHLIRSAGDGPVRHTEPLPDTGQWWLGDEQGRYSSELRLTYCTTPSPSPSPSAPASHPPAQARKAKPRKAKQ
ncbi:lantibiotic dehydratase [Streptomyces huiliensis]|uniref:lantibiotic dehydratase n=1 Tax=Streptomyces huiliensis TaxID=2876027 RepID=UPI001CBB2168|nr:lantibiotic dehydratase [Streptomyces huiliensis]MBZ4319932.1 lantibiotic dehydratase family protein [Streptomyces huiliensis]